MTTILFITQILTLYKIHNMNRDVQAVKADLAEAKKLIAKIAADQNTLNEKIQQLSDRPTAEEIADLKADSASLVSDLSELDKKVEDAPAEEVPTTDAPVAEVPAKEEAPAVADTAATDDQTVEDASTDSATEATV